MTPTSYTFRIEEDTGIRDVVVPLTVDDLPLDLIARLAVLAESDRVAVLLAYRLNIPLDAAQEAIDAFERGEGIEVA